MFKKLLSVLSSCSYIEEVPLDPFIRKLYLPSKLPVSFNYKERQAAVCAMLAKLCPKNNKLSARTVKRICDYYKVDLHGTGVLTRTRNPKMFYVNAEHLLG